MADKFPKIWFEIVDQDDPERTFVFDVTALTSNYTCIFNKGCPGGMGSNMTGCCNDGFYVTDQDDFSLIQKEIRNLSPEIWENYHVAQKKPWWYRPGRGSDRKSRVVNGQCIFYNQNNPDRLGCVFHIAALERGEDPSDHKPYVCAQVPFTTIEIDNETYVTLFTKEDSWGRGESEEHWWCAESELAFVGNEPLYKTYKKELIRIAGVKTYAILEVLLDEFMKSRLKTHPGVPVQITPKKQ